jgi:hypothetical protein
VSRSFFEKQPRESEKRVSDRARFDLLDDVFQCRCARQKFHRDWRKRLLRERRPIAALVRAGLAVAEMLTIRFFVAKAIAPLTIVFRSDLLCFRRWTLEVGRSAFVSCLATITPSSFSRSSFVSFSALVVSKTFRWRRLAHPCGKQFEID